MVVWVSRHVAVCYVQYGLSSSGVGIACAGPCTGPCTGVRGGGSGYPLVVPLVATIKSSTNMASSTRSSVITRSMNKNHAERLSIGHAHAQAQFKRALAASEKNHIPNRTLPVLTAATDDEKEKRRHIVLSSCLMESFSPTGDWCNEHEFNRRVESLGVRVSDKEEEATHLVYGDWELVEAVKVAKRIKIAEGKEVVIIHEKDVKSLIENIRPNI